LVGRLLLAYEDGSCRSIAGRGKRRKSVFQSRQEASRLKNILSAAAAQHKYSYVYLAWHPYYMLRSAYCVLVRYNSISSYGVEQDMPEYSPRASAPYGFTFHIAPSRVTKESDTLIRADLGSLT